MTDETLNLNFEDWNKKITPDVIRLSPIFANDNTPPPPSYPPNPAEWQNLLAVTNAEYLLETSSEIIKQFNKDRITKMQTSHDEVSVKIAHIICAFNLISKNNLIPWVLIFEDSKLIAENFHSRLNMNLKYQQQIFVLLVYYFRDVNIQNKNEYLRTLLYNLATTMTSKERLSRAKYCNN